VENNRPQRLTVRTKVVRAVADGAESLNLAVIVTAATIIPKLNISTCRRRRRARHQERSGDEMQSPLVTAQTDCRPYVDNNRKPIKQCRRRTTILAAMLPPAAYS